MIKFAYIAAIEQYLKVEELPSGKGIADVVYLPKRRSTLPALVVELKWNKSSEGAIRQVKERNYPAVLKDYGGEIVLVGIGYDAKKKAHSCVIERIPWLEVLEDIGGEALKFIEKNGEDGVENQSSQTPEPGSSGKQSSQKPESDSIEKQSTLGLEPSSGENQSSQTSEPGNIEKQSAQASEPAGIKQSALLEVPGRYSGLAYGSTSVYRFSVQEETLYTETLQKGGAWQREERLSGFRWDGKAFAKGEHDRITAEEYDGKVYYIRWGVAFCQKNAGYPSPGALWPNLAGACFTAEGGEDIFGRICLESINEENVLIFTTEHEEYQVVPLVCDSRNEKETCLISETTRDGIVFRLEQEGDRTWLCTGTDRYVREV